MTQTPYQLDPQKRNLSSSLETTTGKFASPKAYGRQGIIPLRRVSLQNRLLSIVLPTLIGTLATSSFLGYHLIHKTAEAEAQGQLANKGILAKDTFTQLLDNAYKISQVIASDPQVLNSLRTSRQKVQNLGLDKLSIDELEQKFSASKLLTPNQELNNYLRQIAEVSDLAEIFYTDSYGFNLAYNQPTSDFVQRDEIWWQQGKNQTQWLNIPDFDESAQAIGFELVQAINDPNSGEFLGVIKALLPENYFDSLTDNLLSSGLEDSQVVQIIVPEVNSVITTFTPQGAIQAQEIVGGSNIAAIADLILSKQQQQAEALEKDLKQKFSLKQLKLDNVDFARHIIAGFVYQNRYYKLLLIPKRNWVVVVSIDNRDLAKAGSELIPLLILNVVLVSLVATAIVSSLSHQISKPLVNLATIAEQAAAGNLDVQAPSLGTVEIEILANSLNNLITQVKELLGQEQKKIEQAKKLQEISQKIQKKLEKNEILATVVTDVRKVLGKDRVIYCQWEGNGEGLTLPSKGRTRVRSRTPHREMSVGACTPRQTSVIAESVVADYPSALGAELKDSCFTKEYIDKYEQGQITAIDNLAQTDVTDSYHQQIESFAVKAILIIPVFVKSKLDGLLIVHQCAAPTPWQTTEIDWLTQIAIQISFAFEQTSFLEQIKLTEEKEKQAKEYIQKRALQLLMEVDPVSQGDLTIRAQVKEDEIGTIADSYNSAIESLQKIVVQVKNVSLEVQANTSENEQAIGKLAQEAVKQAAEIATSMIQIQKMSESIKAVSANAAQAEAVVQNANQNIANGDRSMDQTVAEIHTIQTTVNEAAQKVKQLGESSQTISQAVNLIGRFAAQTHLLALKASIEAARAGEQGKGFAVIADEVRSLAAQSAEATAEIENLVTKIQLETNDVVEAMNLGIQQVEAGTQLVQQTRQSLTAVTAASGEISQLVREIAQAAIVQAETSELVGETIANVATIAEENSQSANRVSTSIKELRQTAEKLQAGIGQFKT
ncbi:MAG: methyl-accepting chemotaxis protein [Xenococcaceae cyanobacterium]